ncbi:DivIVA domain-containing protein [Corynebacterium timonense]|uniref:Cell division septum initiation DivIVA, interacts with FtsZ, MinD n=1 Tax=Corynebacterium timonense TaxID=441500 RepID=A0A1H1MVF4_9CORY|nr:DivIVA domain-containing protein [Corynebacterium timonense]SDR90714.1 Cell division septum initiation DivIVA, interacts with FtsZ, MinD [Corynebacterium timonense]
MYRVFEALDELVRTVEQAYGVPMTSNCMVPRNDVLALLDDIRNALPVEVDDAQDVLDQQDEILRGAQERADTLVADAEDEAERIMRDVHNQTESMLSDAQSRAAHLVSTAEEDAERTVARAREEADQTVASARGEADRLIDNGNQEYERAVDAGLAEQQRLVGESEVMRRADEEARRLVENAHADSSRLRAECDDYVDSKLSEFEESLSAVLRTVSSDRSALRRGAGASGERYERRDYGRRPRSGQPQRDDNDSDY